MKTTLLDAQQINRYVRKAAGIDQYGGMQALVSIIYDDDRAPTAGRIKTRHGSRRMVYVGEFWLRTRLLSELTELADGLPPKEEEK